MKIIKIVFAVIFAITITAAQAMYFDGETGLDYNMNRDYDSKTGRYLESDPIGLAGGSFSTYTYADNNPLSKIDPLGLATFMCSRNLSGLPFRGGPLYHQ